MDSKSPYKPTPQTPHYVHRPGEQTLAAAPLQTPIYGEQPGTPHANDYAFIMNPEKSATKPNVFSGSSLPVRLVFGAVAFLAIIIVLNIAKGVVGGSNNFPQYVSVAADQQAIINITTAAALQPSLSPSTQNVVYTTQLGMTTNQGQIITYLTTNKQKIGKKQLASKLSATTDAQLTAAVTAGNYETVLRGILKTQFETYQQDLGKAYDTTKGPHGKALLKAQYAQAELLNKQLAQH